MQQLGNSEVKQFWYTLCRHENVGRLDIAMNNKILVSVEIASHTLQNNSSLSSRDRASREFGDRLAFKIFHHQIWQTVVVEPPSRSPAMLGCSRRARIWRSITKRLRTACVHPALDQLDGNGLVERFVRMRGEITVPIPPRPISLIICIEFYLSTDVLINRFPP